MNGFPWTVLVNASGGWTVLAAFVDESAAWSYGATQLEARVRRERECLAHKAGYKEPWRPCDATGPCARSAELGPVDAPRVGDCSRADTARLLRRTADELEEGALRGLVLVVSAKHGVFAEDGPLTLVSLLDTDGHGDLYTGLSVAHGDLAIAWGTAKSRETEDS